MIVPITILTLTSLKHAIAEQICSNIIFFPYTVIEWNKLLSDLRNAKSYLIFRDSLLKLGNPSPSSVYDINDLVGLKLFRILRIVSLIVLNPCPLS